MESALKKPKKGQVMLKLGKQSFQRNDLRDIAGLPGLDLWLLHVTGRHDMFDVSYVSFVASGVRELQRPGLG